jgi:hypothetical protein
MTLDRDGQRPAGFAGAVTAPCALGGSFDEAKVSVFLLSIVAVPIVVDPRCSPACRAPLAKSPSVA